MDLRLFLFVGLEETTSLRKYLLVAVVVVTLTSNTRIPWQKHSGAKGMRGVCR